MQPVRRLGSTGCIRSHRSADELHKLCPVCLADEGGVQLFIIKTNPQSAFCLLNKKQLIAFSLILHLFPLINT